jgi:hypothetical protein
MQSVLKVCENMNAGTQAKHIPLELQYDPAEHNEHAETPADANPFMTTRS